MNEKGGQRRYVRLSLFDDFQTLAILNFSQIIYTRRKIERKEKRKIISVKNIFVPISRKKNYSV